MKGLRVAAVLFTALLVVTAVPAQVSAATGTLVVGSQHTDFGTGSESSPKTLSNLTIQGSGDSASVQLLEKDTVTRPDDDGTFGTSGKTGLKIVPETDITQVNLTVSSNTASATTAYVTTTGGTVLQSTSLSSGHANMSVDLTAGVGYYVVLDAGGSSYTAGELSSVNYPYDGELADITAGVSGGTEFSTLAFSIKSLTLEANDSSPDRKYVSAKHSVTNPKEASINITQASNVSVEATVRTDGGTVLNQTTLTSAGNHTLALAGTSSDQLETVLDVTVTGDNPQFELADESILFNNDAPTVDDTSASPTADFSQQSVTLSINASDQTFGTAQGEVLTATFYVDGSQVGTDTLTSNGTASVQYDATVGGSHDWYVVVEDSYGATVTSDTFTFNVPSELRLYNVSAPDTLVQTSSNVTIRFYANDRIVEKTTTDGTVNLTGLPVSETMVVQINAPDYVERTVVIESIYEQQDFYLLNSTRTTARVEFTLDDKTGQFPASSTRLAIERPITKDFDGDGTDETRWKIVAADYFDAAKEFSTTLEDNTRYRLRVKNEEGDTRILGGYTTNGDSAEPLPIGEVVVQPDGGKGYAVEATITENKSGGKYIRLVVVDGQDLTSSLTYSVTERNNASNVTVSNTTVSGPYGQFSVLIDIPDSGDESYQINVWLDRDGQTVKETRYVGSVPPIVETFNIDAKWASPLAWVGILGITGFVVINNRSMAPMAGTGMAVIMTMLGAVAIPTPLLAGAAGLSVLGAVAGGGR